MQVCEIKRRSSESLNSVFLHITLVLPYGKRMCLSISLIRALWLEALTDQACVIASINWRTPATILFALQPNE